MITTVTKRALTPELRIVQLYYALVVFAGLMYAAFANPKASLDYYYDLSMVRAVFQMWTSMQAIWLIQRRAAGARLFCLITTSICLVLSFIDNVVFHSTSPLFTVFGEFAGNAQILFEYVFAGLVIAFFIRSEDARSVLSIPLDNSPAGPGHSWDTPWRQRVRSWPFWRDLSIYFMLFSFLGHWAEMLFCRLIVAGVFMGGYDPTNAMLWDQWLFPFSAEGIALAMVVIFLHPLKLKLCRKCNGNTLKALGISFLATAAICTSIDFLTGMVANQNYELWDYRDMPFNFMGQVCLQNSMVYSIAATLIVWVIYPLMDRVLRKLPQSVVDALFFGLVGVYAFEAALHFIVI